MHPLAEDFSQLKEPEIELRLQDLTKKYFQATNPHLKKQISTFIDIYRTELQTRRSKILEQQYQKRDKGLDNLINVS
jgi:hypothetical protein